MNRLLIQCFIVLLISIVPVATTSAAEVMLIGTFHFANPGHDVVKTDVIDVTSAESQQYLEQLTARLAAFKPDKVLLEYSPKNDAEINTEYQAYRNDEWPLEVNEIYQLGFRIARQAGLERVHSFDNRDVEWPYQQLAEYAQQHAPQTWQSLQEVIVEHTRREQQQQTELDLRQLLIASNDPAMLRVNKDLYLLTNAVGAGDNFIGADAAASWWQRNFRMYALIQQAAQAADRVVVIGGSGHIAILRDLLAIDQRHTAVDVADYW
ncbi:MAG: hypothetical protein Tsb002_23440 [Wenzhouxiangellaceae bacterium]